MKRIIRLFIASVCVLGLSSCIADLTERVDSLENEVNGLPHETKALNIELSLTEINAYDGTASFTVTDATDPYVVVYGDADMTFTVSDVIDGKGSVHFTRGAAATTKIFATVIDNAEKGNNSNTKVLRVNFETGSYNASIADAGIGAAGGPVSFSFSTNCPYTLRFPEWISATGTKAVKEYSETVYVSANPSYRRSGTVEIINSATDEVIDCFTIEQKGGVNDLYILNEGAWGSNNASLSRLEMVSGELTESWYSDVNRSPLGDVGNDIIITEDYIIIAVNSSNIIQVCDLEGKAVAQIEDIPNNRKLATDPAGDYLYVTSYAEDGYVAKVDLTSFEVSSKTNVGYEPEGLAYYNGKLYVANSGGYAYTGTHGYEQSISVINAASMVELKRIDTGMLNLYGAFVQSDTEPRYILVNAAGDYYMNPGGSFIFDCETEEVISRFETPATYACVRNGSFYSVGSEFSYTTYEYEYYFKTISVSNGNTTVKDGIISEYVEEGIKALGAPYGVYMSRDGELFVSDAGNYVNKGSLVRFSADGSSSTKYVVGVCPGHFAER